MNNEGAIPRKRIYARFACALVLSVGAASQVQLAHSAKNLPGTFVVTVNFEGTTFKVLQNFTRDGRSIVLLVGGDTRVGGPGRVVKNWPPRIRCDGFF